MARRLQKRAATGPTSRGSTPRSLVPAPVELQPEPVWYGHCRHWTENWEVLANKGGVPLCPIDGAPGFHNDGGWWEQVDAYEAKGHPGYRHEVEGLRIGGRL